MAIERVGGAASSSPALEGSKEKFGKALREAPSESSASPAQASPTTCAPGAQQAARGSCAVKPGARAEPAPTLRADQAGKMLDHVAAAQHRLDRILALASTGKTFTPAQLLSFQAQVYSASQELDLAGKVVEKSTAGIKLVLQTQV